MKDRMHREDLSLLVEHRRRELAERPDVSQRTRALSASSSRNQIGRRTPRRSTLRTLIFGVVAVVMVIGCATSAVAVVAGSFWVRDQLGDPATVVQQYYSALHQRNYIEAYSYFTTPQKGRISQDVFTDRNSSLDQLNGAVEAYPVTSKTVQGSTATIVVQVTRQADMTTAQVQTLKVVKQGSVWRIDSVTIGAVVPLPTATAG
ncbi:MAG TPA: hypothetical protein VJN88_05935 [Ktedonobacterales bacterium]|nr:hypothetical protein [Ktedonobacterales bacterium]